MTELIKLRLPYVRQKGHDYMADIEKAIEQIKKADMELCVGLIKSGNQFIPKQSTPLMEAIDTAIQSLQEKAEREKGCEYCNEGKWFEEDGEGAFIKENYLTIKSYAEPDTIISINYCPMCGRKLR